MRVLLAAALLAAVPALSASADPVRGCDPESRATDGPTTSCQCDQEFPGIGLPGKDPIVPGYVVNC